MPAPGGDAAGPRPPLGTLCWSLLGAVATAHLGLALLHPGYLPRALAFGAASAALALLVLAVVALERRRHRLRHARTLAEQRRTEAALVASEQRLALALEAASDALFDVDLRTGATYCSPRYLTMLGYGPGELVPSLELWRTLLHPEDRPRAEAALARYAEGRAETHQLELRLRAKDGSWCWVLSRGRIAARDPAGRPLRLIGTHVDITERKQAELALRQAKDFAERLVATANALIVCLDPTGCILVFNTAAQAATGYTAAELTGRNWFETLAPRDRYPKVWAEFRRLLSGGTPEHFEHPILTKAGEERLVAWHNGLLRDGGAIVGTISCGIDVTEKRRTEQALLKERDLVARLLETSPSGIVVVDTDGQVTFANNEAEHILGLRRLGPAGHRYAPPAWHLFQPDGSPVAEADRTFRRVLATRQSFHDLRHELRWDDGRRVLLSLNAAPLLDATGAVEGVVSTFDDITAREHAAAALRQSEEQYRLLFNAGNDALFVHGFDSAGHPDRFSQVNDIACELLGYTREALLALRPSDLNAPDCATCSAEVVARLHREHHALFELELVARDGRRLPVEINSRLFQLAGHPTVLSVVRDISERRRLEAQLRQAQKMEVFGQLAGGVAHDFNNLLVAIIGNAELLADSPELSPRTREQLVQIQGAGQRAAALTRQLLVFARQQPLQPTPCDLGTVVAEHAQLLRRIIGEDVEFVLAPALDPLPIRADVNMIEQVAMNLVVNARDAMPRGGTLTLHTARIALDTAAAARCLCPPGDYAALVVADTGCGIPLAIRPRIFEPFFTTKPAGQGTGLGLSTVLGIVQQHRGGVAFTSEENHGTTFSVYLPLEATAGAPPPASPETTHTVAPATILVVEDDTAVRTIIERLLGKEGYRVVLATAAAEGLAQLEHATVRFDLVLSDVVMPGGMDGIELAAQVARRWPALPVLLMSGYARNLAAGQVRMLAKPFSSAQLLAYLQEGLAQRAATAAH